MIAACLIAVSPPRPAPSLERTLAESCSAAARPLHCEVLEEGSTLTATATIAWESETLVRVDARPASAGPATTRWVQFRTEDPEQDRWQALGLVVASLLESSGADAAPAKRATAEAAARLPVLWMNGGAAAGRGLDAGPPRIGAWLGAGYRTPVLPLFVGLGASEAVASGSTDLKATWTAFSARLGLDLVASRLALAVRPYVGFLSERMVAEVASGPYAGGSGSRWLDGGLLGMEAAWPATSALSLVVGAQGSWLSGGTAVRLDDREIASFPALSYQVLLGVQVALVREGADRRE